MCDSGTGRGSLCSSSDEMIIGNYVLRRLSPVGKVPPGPRILGLLSGCLVFRSLVSLCVPGFGSPHGHSCSSLR